VIQTNKAKTNPIKAKTKPIQTQLLQRPKLMQSEYLQRIKKKNAAMGQKNKAKTKPIPKRLKMNAFAWIRSFTIVFCDFLAEFTTLKGANFK